MSSRLFVLALALGLGWLPASRANPDRFVAAVFATPPPPRLVAIQGDLAANAATILGRAYPGREVSCWAADGQTAWVLTGRGRYGLFTAGFVVRDGRIARSDVLAYKEARGREIQHASFLQQFQGVALDANRELDRRIDGITGATISANSMRNLARLALYLDQTVNPETDPAPAR